MTPVYVDIEAIPSQEAWVREFVEKTVTHPAIMSKPETIAKWEAEERPKAVEQAMDKTVFDGAMNQIVCVGLAIGDNEPKVFTGVEKDILYDFYADIKATSMPQIVGHNVLGFDLRVIRQRSIIHGVKPPTWFPFDAKPWDTIRLYDTMIQWDSKNFTKLDKLAKAFGIDGKTTDGSQVYGWWKNGEIERIAKHCLADVRLTREVFKRMTYATTTS